MIPLSKYLSILFVLAAPVAAQQSPATVETFESFAVASNRAERLDVFSIDENSIANGQGPGLVVDGCVYSAPRELQWNGVGYFGQPSKNINTGWPALTLTYDFPVFMASMTLHAFDGFPDNATVTAYDSNGVVLQTLGPMAIPDAFPVPVAFNLADIKSIVIEGTLQWSPMLDNHVFEGGFGLSVSGSCPGVMTASVSKATAGGQVALIYSFGIGGFVIPTGQPCAGTVLGLSSAGITLATTLTADASGNASFPANVPGGACGRVFVQALDVTTCTTSGVVGI